MGIGAAWNDVEHAGYGYEFPPVRQRMDRLDEALTIIRAMFTEERPSFEGRYYRIEEALNVPRPVQPRGPRILVGGGGEQRTLKIAAKHADMTHWFPLGFDVLRHKNVGPPEQMADALRPYLDAGFTGFTFNNSIYQTPEAISRIGELLQLVGGATAAIA